MSEKTNPKDPSILRIETIGTYRDALRATVAAMSARDAYEETFEKMGAAQPSSPVEDAFRQLTLSQSRKAWEGAIKALEMAREDYAAATEACPLPTTPETQIEGHVLREAAVARRSLDNALKGRDGINPEQSLEEIIDAVLEQEPLAEPKIEGPSGFAGKVRPNVQPLRGGKAVLGGF